ncbi:MAG: hypothetical protein ACI90E_002312 [Yoonia sp.]
MPRRPLELLGLHPDKEKARQLGRAFKKLLVVTFRQQLVSRN